MQSNLTVLGYNTRGIDGIFGRGTRAAIAGWQDKQGFSTTSYLTQLQVARLERQGAARRAEIRAEDEAYWASTGATGREPDLVAYLERYPQGRHAAEAKKMLNEIALQRARAAERAAWDTAREADTAAAYRAFLEAHPDGRFAAQARTRLQQKQAEEQAEQQAALDAAAEEEIALNLRPIARVLVEQRLAQLGLQPGQVDGSFDEATRRALRGFQQSQNLPVTGYLTEATLGALLADSLRQLRDL